MLALRFARSFAVVYHARFGVDSRDAADALYAGGLALKGAAGYLAAVLSDYTSDSVPRAARQHSAANVKVGDTRRLGGVAEKPLYRAVACEPQSRDSVSGSVEAAREEGHRLKAAVSEFYIACEHEAFVL